MQAVIIERRPPIATVILNRPTRRNAVDPATALALEAAAREIDRDANVHCAVLWGAGGHFCAGYDLKALATANVGALYDTTPNGPMGPTRTMPATLMIAAVEGFAVAGGLELALWCDLRVAAKDAVFGVFNRRFGVPLVDGGTVRLPRLIGEGRALDMILTGREVGAEEAHAIGLVDRVVPKEQARTEAEALAARIAAFPPESLRADRRSARTQWGLDLDVALHNEAEGGREPMINEAGDGARRFTEGAGRGGRIP